MGGSSSGGTTVVQYETHIVDHHSRLMNSTEVFYNAISPATKSPYIDYTDIDVDSAFFGVGYLVSSFPSLYDMFGKFMAGLDIGTMWYQDYTNVTESSAIGDAVVAQGALLSDDIESEALPRFEAGMRDINAVMSSTFVIGRVLLEEARLKKLAQYDAELRNSMVPVALEVWKTRTTWNQNVVKTYAELIKLFYSAKMDITEYNYSMAARNKLWPFTVTEYYRTVVGTLNGAQESRSDTKGTSTTAKVIGGALSGAAAGAMIGGPTGIGAPMGAAIGGVLGAAAGLL